MQDDTKTSEGQKTTIYVVHIVLSCLLTCFLNVIHSVYILEINLSPASFIMPLVAGLFFGYLLSRIKLLGRQLTHIAYTDSLTRIYNRLHFGHFLEAEIDRVKRYGGTCSVIFFDIDFFKKINDQHGHLVGDDVLTNLTALVNAQNRNSDVFARYGGEEFIILTSSTDLAGATTHAEHLREKIATTSFDKIGKLTCSFGVAEFNKEKDDITTIIRRVDAALYNAKANGRNCVVQALI